jgi:hypothetical protein
MSIKYKRFVAVVAALLLSCSQTVLYGQAHANSVAGRVTDQSQAVIADAQVKLTDQSTGVSLTTTTNAVGAYEFVGLLIGTYTLSVTKNAFETWTRPGITIHEGQNAMVDVSLTVGSTTQTVTVTAPAPVLEARSGSMQTQIDTSSVEELPILLTTFKRDPSLFLTTLPGYQGGAGFSNNINGSIGEYTEVLVDGLPAERDPAVPGIMQNFLSSEAIGEFELADTPSADLGLTGGNTISIVSKSGTNALHGTVYEYLHNSGLDSRNFFASTVAPNIWNEYGFDVGGPVIIPHVYNGKNKTFFFFNWGKALLHNKNAAGFSTVPLSAWRTGDFSALLGSQIGTDVLGRPIYSGEIYDPATTRPDGQGGFIRDPFLGNMIPKNRWSPVSVALQSFIPQPNQSGFVNDYLTPVGTPGITDNTWFSIKIDHAWGNNRLSVTYWRDYWDQVYSQSFPLILAGLQGNLQHGHNPRFNYTRTFSPRLVNQVVAAYDRNYVNPHASPAAMVGATTIGLTGTLDTCMPIAAISGVGSWQAGSYCIDVIADSIPRIADNVTYAVGKHILKFGGDYTRWRKNNLLNQYSSGYYSFLGGQTGLPGKSLAQTGFSYASFLLGEVDYSQEYSPTYNMPRLYEFGLYIQDEYRITPKLTLNYGLRWDVQPMAVDAHNNWSNFSPTVPNPGAGGRLGALTYLGFGPGRLTEERVSPTDYHDFGPRIGVAYKVAPKTVLRASWGYYYGPIHQAAEGFSAQVNRQGLNPAFAFTSPDGYSSVFNWNTGFPLPSNALVLTYNPAAANGSGSSFVGKDADHAPRIIQVNAGLQYELPRGVLAELDYFGNFGRGVINGYGENINQMNYQQYGSLGSLLAENINSTDARNAGIPIPYTGFNGTVAQALTPFPQYGPINNYFSRTGTSDYNSLLIKFQKHYSNGLSFLMGYTISKTLADEASDAGYFASAPQDFYNRRLEKTVSNIDIPQNLIFSYTYELPLGPGKRFLKSQNPAVKYLLAGWNIAGVHTYQSGTPIGVGTDLSLPTTNGGVHPNIVSGVPQRTAVSCGAFNPATDLYLNINAFAFPAPFHFGNATSREPNLRSCANFNENISVFKKIPLYRERAFFEFGADGFDIFNRHGWGAPAANLSSPGTFGKISSASGPRNVQVHARIRW